MLFYCVTVEFYDSGKVLACMTGKETKKMPNSHYRQVPGMMAFKIWLTSEKTASQLIEMIQNGAVDSDDVLCFYSNYQDYRIGIAA